MLMAGAPVPDHPNIHSHFKRAQGLKGPWGHAEVSPIARLLATAPTGRLPGSNRHHASRLFSSILSSSVIGRYSHAPDFQRRIRPKCDRHSPLRSSFRTKAIHKSRMSKTAALMKIKLHGPFDTGLVATAHSSLVCLSISWTAQARALR